MISEVFIKMLEFEFAAGIFIVVGNIRQNDRRSRPETGEGRAMSYQQCAL